MLLFALSPDGKKQYVEAQFSYELNSSTKRLVAYCFTTDKHRATDFTPREVAAWAVELARASGRSILIDTK